MLIKLMLVLQAAATQGGPGTPDLRDIDPPTLPQALAVVSKCRDGGEPDEVVICGSRPDRFRLPLPNERESSGLTVRSPGDALAGMAALTAPGRCGMFEGERRCSKAEAAQYGYGRGRDPITLLLKLGTALLDPDAEVGEPSEKP